VSNPDSIHLSGSARIASIVKNRVPVRTLKDLEAASRKIADMFETDVVIVVGSQAVLNSWGNKAPEEMRTSAEIDLYPGNRKAWEEAQKRLAGNDESYLAAAEHIYGIAGEGQAFDEIHGFYLDGVDDTTSPLPAKWQTRAAYREFPLANGGTVTAVSPSIEDTIASKLVRLAEKDKMFIEAAYRFRPFDIEAMRERMETIAPFASYTQEYLDACRANASAFLGSLPKQAVLDPQGVLAKQLAKLVPDLPDTHCAFFNLANNSVTVRKWNPDMGVYYKIDNPLGPAMVAKGFSHYVLDGEKLDREAWLTNPEVVAAKAGGSTGVVPPWKVAEDEPEAAGMRL
jgi:hypothetical protein